MSILDEDGLITFWSNVVGKIMSHSNDKTLHIPTPQTSDNAKFLRNDNTWQTVTPANIGAAASSHNHSASNITSGTLPITRGGTGATTAEAARANLGITDEIVYGTTAPTSSTTGSIYIQTT